MSLVLLNFSLQKGVLSRLLSWRPLVTGGEISYSFYLIHLFVLLPFAEWQRANGNIIPWQLSVPVLFTVCIGLSLLSHRYFEKPMNRKIKQLFDTQQHGTTL